jgi:quinohemoprotein ethanol dehydrogenase
MGKRGRMIALGVLSMLGVAAWSKGPAPQLTGSAALYRDSADGRDWPGVGRTYGEQHFSPLAQIDQANVGRLKLAWYQDLDTTNSVSQPVEVGGTLYFATGVSVVHAVDAKSGKTLWIFDPHAGERAGKALRYFWGTRGVSWWNGKVYVGTADGRLIAIDARSGKQVWSQQVVDPAKGLYLTGAPRAAAGKIITGESNGDYTAFRGFADAYDAETGKHLWRFYTVPGNPAVDSDWTTKFAARTWTGDWWRWGPGGNPWNAFSYDAETDTVMFGTADTFPFNPRIRSPGGGDNLFGCSIVALDATTGQYKWHYQFVPSDAWDYDGVMDIELADLVIAGRPRKVAMIAPKDGFFYVLDRTSGQLLSAEKIAKVSWADHIDLKTGRPVENPDARYYKTGKPFEIWPSMRGAHSVPPMAYSPQTRLAYIPRLDSALVYDDHDVTPDHVAQWGINISLAKDNPLNNTSALLAWDPVKQKAAWKVDTFGGWNGGLLATAGGLVFQGQLDGRFSAYAATTGKELWHSYVQAPVLAAPISYMVGDKQYVSLLVGIAYSASAEAFSHKGITLDREQRRRLLTFMIDGSAKLPPMPPSRPLTPPADPGYRPDPPLAQQGAMIFADKCAYCHGQLAIGGGYGPDLRASEFPFLEDGFRALLRDGPLVATGMPKWDDLSDQDIVAIRQYIRSRAADLRAGK